MEGMSFIVKSATRMLIGIIFSFSLYITFYGHLTPGGGFAGGIMLACGFILLTLAFGKTTALGKLSDYWASIFDNLGALIFWLIALIYNIAIGVKVFASVFAVFLALTIFGRFVSGLVSTDEE
jgi:multisubunit Na+/H+ antiporter MnhB subunit